MYSYRRTNMKEGFICLKKHWFLATSIQVAAPGKFEAKRLEALEHSNDDMAVSSSG
jgi:hypothetical protein